MSQALYRKYRSRSLDEIVGQEHITSLLKKAIAQGSVSHAYLLTGPKGVGKTSIARIIAHEINKLEYSDESQHLDIIEIDAASNNGVEDVRDLREKIHIAPSSATKKIYIIDEVHMLSKAAFNALLKTLEEPPEHVVFILATTDADKLPGTIISRVQRFNFRAISTEDALRHLRTIADKESIKISDDALALIAKHGNGSFRDSIGMLDQLRHVNEDGVNLSDVQKSLGITSADTIQSLLTAYRSSDLSQLTSLIRSLEISGVQASIVTSQLIDEIHSDITSHPDELDLLDSLLDVASSSHPYIKLLSVLAINARPKPRVDTAKTPPKSIREKTSPSISSPASTPIKSTIKQDEKPKSVQDKPARESEAHPASATLIDFDWKKMLDVVKSDIALSSLLAKCDYATDGNDLIIFAGNKFNHGQLSGPKQLPKLNAALQNLGYEDIAVSIKPEKAPPRDSHLAEIAAIMGGGEEVELADG